MMRLVITLGLLASCGGSKAAPVTPGGDGPPPIAKRVVLSWGIEPHGASADVYLATTDETGKQVSHPVGSYRGTCAVIVPARAMNAVSGVACRYGGTGTELHAVIQRGVDVVILRLTTDEGVTPDPMAREEVTRISVPLGTGIDVGG
jgi:hypothetical protein